ncbi:MAG: PAS domain-containing protein, partial [Bacteroidota bacterium]|nr:PAS domain-containing protein [Bacteroidota bacterium]
KNLENWPVEYVSENVKNILGYSTNDFISEKIIYSKIIHEEDLQRVSDEVIENSKTDKQSFEHKPYRIISKTGKIKWIKDITLIRKNEDKEITHYEGIIFDITKQKENEEKLKKAQQIAKLGHWELDIINNKLTWSDEIYRIFDLKPQEFGATYEAFLNNIHPKDRDRVNEAYTNSLKTKSPYEIEHRLLLKSGKIKYVLEKCDTEYDKSGNPVRSLGTVLDITERKKAEQELQNQNKEYASLNEEYKTQNEELIIAKNKAEENEIKWKSLTANTLDTIQIIDNEYNIRYINKTNSLAEKEKIIGTSIFIYVPEKYHKTIKNTIETVKKTGIPKKYETSLKLDAFDKRIHEMWFSVNVVPLKIGKETLSIFLIASEITKQKKYERELIIAKEKAEESNQLKTEFINNMSHEIRTPMNGILGFSKILEKPNLTDTKKRHYINIIQNSGNQLMRIIDDILEISKLGTKQIKSYEKKICLNDLFLELFSIFDIKAKENKTPLYLHKELSDKESV